MTIIPIVRCKRLKRGPHRSELGDARAVRRRSGWQHPAVRRGLRHRSERGTVAGHVVTPLRAAVTPLAAAPILAATTWIPVATQSRLRPAIVFVSTRDNPAGTLAEASDISLVDVGGTQAQRLNDNHDGDSLPAISPDGTRIVFDSNRLRTAGQPANTTQLFLMNIDGSAQTPLISGSSASWSPDGKRIAFHASASGAAAPTRVEPGAPSSDSDIFIADVAGLLAKRATPRNLTNTPAALDDDADWSPDGRRIVYTSRAATVRGSNAVNDPSAEIYVINADGSGAPLRLTTNQEEERAPAWSPDGRRILYVARKGGPDFELCVMNADGTGQTQLTDNAVGDLTPSSPP